MANILNLKIPINITTPADKTEFLYKAEETLRLLHNSKGMDYKDGKITQEEWETWLETYYFPRHRGVIIKILENRALLKNSTKYTVDPETDFEVSIGG